jgi:hypothetical protein
MKKLLSLSIRVLPLFLLSALGGCASLAGMHERSSTCAYDHAWEAALEVVKDRSTDTKDKEAGLIVTHWLEIPMPGRTYGVFRRTMEDSRDRSRVTLRVKRADDTTKILFIEERQSWGFRGGSRLFGWAPTAPSEEVMRDIQNRLDAKLQEHGCSAT